MKKTGFRRAAGAAGAAVLALAAGAYATTTTQTPYAGQQARAIKALPDDDVRALLAGAGMGFAKAAELNSYPGPMHALELADALGLDARQREALQALMGRHKAEARALGADVVRLERELDALFAERRATAEAVERKTAEIGAAQARLRAAHLTTHVAAAALLTQAQIERYDALRGYRNTGNADGASTGGNAPAHHHRRHR